MQNEDFPPLTSAISHHWELEQATIDQMEVLHAKLSERIQYLLLNETETLMQLLYRMDVPEKKFHTAMQLHPLTKIGDEIANLVIERELQKVITRRKYRETGNI